MGLSPKNLLLCGTDGSNPAPSSSESGELAYCRRRLVPISSNASPNCRPSPDRDCLQTFGFSRGKTETPPARNRQFESSSLQRRVVRTPVPRKSQREIGGQARAVGVGTGGSTPASSAVSPRTFGLPHRARRCCNSVALAGPDRETLWGGRRGVATSSLHLTMECRDAPAERPEQVPRRPGSK